jgi:sugar phosphate isomerase/epimerase
MHSRLTRRQWLSATAAAVSTGAASVAGTLTAAQKKFEDDPPFLYCLNTSTIRGQKLTIVQEIDIASRAGYNAIEPWASELDQYVKDGGDLADLGKRCRDAGLTIEDLIAFPTWVVDDDAVRKKGFDEARRVMEMARKVGAKRIALPPAGANDKPDINLHRAAERYRALLDVGENLGVVPQVELWGHSKFLNRLGDAALVAIDSGHPQACILADVFHLYKGGSGFTGLKLLSGSALQMLHMNDYPLAPDRAALVDAQRVYPGDGTAPLKQILSDLRRPGFRVVLSLELFNRDLWAQDALVVAKTGLEKMKSVVKASAG